MGMGESSEVCRVRRAQNGFCAGGKGWSGDFMWHGSTTFDSCQDNLLCGMHSNDWMRA